MKVKCVFCEKEIPPTAKYDNEWTYDEQGDVCCMPCAEKESDTGEIY